MAQREFNTQLHSLSKKRVVIDVEVTIGASGAPTLASASSGQALKNRGVASIVKSDTGKYTLTLSDKYQRVVGLSGTVQSATGVPAAPVFTLFGAPANGSGSTGMVVIFCTVLTATLTEPAEGETLYLTVVLEDSTAN